MTDVTDANLCNAGRALLSSLRYYLMNRAVARTLVEGVYIHIFGFCPTDFF